MISVGVGLNLSAFLVLYREHNTTVAWAVRTRYVCNITVCDLKRYIIVDCCILTKIWYMRSTLTTLYYLCVTIKGNWTEPLYVVNISNFAVDSRSSWFCLFDDKHSSTPWLNHSTIGCVSHCIRWSKNETVYFNLIRVGVTSYKNAGAYPHILYTPPRHFLSLITFLPFPSFCTSIRTNPSVSCRFQNLKNYAAPMTYFSTNNFENLARLYDAAVFWPIWAVLFYAILPRTNSSRVLKCSASTSHDW